MVDLHCHFLPGVDDGPDTMDEALDLARAAVADGIRFSVLTSHLYSDRGKTRHHLQTVFDAYSERLAAEGIPLQVSLGCEAHLSFDLLDQIAADQVPFLGEVDGYRILLLEFPHQMIPLGSDKLVATLVRQKIRPLIAHPERNDSVMEQSERIQPFVDLGCWLQLNAGSLCGRFGTLSEQTAWQLLDAGLDCFIATDAHDVHDRPPCLSEGRDALRRRYGEQFALDHVCHKPARIIAAATQSSVVM